MIAAGQQRRPGGRAHRRGVEAVVRDPFINNAIHRRGLDLATERGRQSGAGVVDQHDENVRRVGGKPPRRRPWLIDRLLHRAPGDAGRGCGWKRQGILLLQFCLYLSDPPFHVLPRAIVTTRRFGIGPTSGGWMVPRLASICDLWSFEPDVCFGSRHARPRRQGMTAVCAKQPPADWVLILEQKDRVFQLQRDL